MVSVIVEMRGEERTHNKVSARLPLGPGVTHHHHHSPDPTTASHLFIIALQPSSPGLQPARTAQSKAFSASSSSILIVILAVAKPAKYFLMLEQNWDWAGLETRY